jgi:hypothetical protein
MRKSRSLRPSAGRASHDAMPPIAINKSATEVTVFLRISSTSWFARGSLDCFCSITVTFPACLLWWDRLHGGHAGGFRLPAHETTTASAPRIRAGRLLCGENDGKHCTCGDPQGQQRFATSERQLGPRTGSAMSHCIIRETRALVVPGDCESGTRRQQCP